MTIDWTNAPEGATHYADQPSGFVWLKDDFDLSFWGVWEDGAWRLSSITKPIPRPASTAIPAEQEIERLRAELEAKDEALQFMKGAQQEWYEMYMQKRDAISRFKAGLIRAGAKAPIDAMTMNAHEQGLSIALVCLESELDQAAKRKYDLASIVSREEQDDEN